MEGKCQGNYEAMRVKSNIKSSHRVVTFKHGRKWREKSKVSSKEKAPVGTCTGWYQANGSALVISPLFMAVNHLRCDPYMAGYFLHANGPIKDRIHHVEYHNAANSLCARGVCEFMIQPFLCWFTWPSRGTPNLHAQTPSKWARYPGEGNKGDLWESISSSILHSSMVCCIHPSRYKCGAEGLTQVRTSTHQWRVSCWA